MRPDRRGGMVAELPAHHAAHDLPDKLFLIVVTVIGSFNSFALVKALTDGGPGSASRIITLFIYEQAFKYSYYSYSNALACLLFLFILLVTLLQWRAQKAWVHY